MPDRAVAVETTISAPFAAVWRALRDPAEIRRWHGWEYDADGGLDGEIDIMYRQGAEADEAAGTIAIADGSRFELEDRGTETVVRVTMPAPAGGASWDEFYADVREGWTTFVAQLRFALEHHPGEERRTLMLDGPPAVAPDGATGSAYASTTPWGEALSGRIQARTAHQVVLTVDAYGPGLSRCTPSRAVAAWPTPRVKDACHHPLTRCDGSPAHSCCSRSSPDAAAGSATRSRRRPARPPRATRPRPRRPRRRRPRPRPSVARDARPARTTAPRSPAG
jgi:uncharacterized protein YndB with AHSA1/START domain